MANLNARSEKPLGLFRFGCFRLQNAVYSIPNFAALKDISFPDFELNYISKLD